MPEPNVLLQVMCKVLRIHQDIEDQLRKDATSDGDKLAGVRTLNDELGRLCAEVLPG
jgi:hypothetical protein